MRVRLRDETFMEEVDVSIHAPVRVRHENFEKYLAGNVSIHAPVRVRLPVQETRMV